MKMGRLIAVLFLFVVGAGCSDKGESKTGAGSQKAAAVADACTPVDNVTRWEPAKPEANPNKLIKAGQTIFVFAGTKTLRAKMANSTERDRIVPLNELRDEKEPLWWGVAPKDCWAKEVHNEVEISCVKCTTKVRDDTKLNEPCCLSTN